VAGAKQLERAETGEARSERSGRGKQTAPSPVRLHEQEASEEKKTGTGSHNETDAGLLTDWLTTLPSLEPMNLTELLT
jgi:hypothetical protein